MLMWYQCNSVVFLSTLSLRRATSAPVPCGPHADISIHALLAESDMVSGGALGGTTKFLSTLSLRRATPIMAPPIGPVGNFYPRSPCGERPLSGVYNCTDFPISIHALLAESDNKRIENIKYAASISIHALLAESDSTCSSQWTRARRFLSTLSLRRATLADCTKF